MVIMGYRCFSHRRSVVIDLYCHTGTSTVGWMDYGMWGLLSTRFWSPNNGSLLFFGFEHERYRILDGETPTTVDGIGPEELSSRRCVVVYGNSESLRFGSDITSDIGYDDRGCT